MRYWAGVKTVLKSILMKNVLGIWTKFMWLVKDLKVQENADRFQGSVAVQLRPSHLRDVMWHRLAVVYRQLSTAGAA